MFGFRKPVRKIIGGLLYDTSVAEKVISFRKLDMVFGKYEKTTMYKGETEWFLESNGKIVPIDEDNAKKLLSMYGADKFIEYFGEVEYA